MSPRDKRVEVLERRPVYRGFFTLEEVRLRYERRDGTMSQEMTRLLFERGDAAAILPYDPHTREVILVRQFRYPAWVRGGPGWLWEIIAGMCDGGRSPEEVARAEAMEEAGYTVGALRHIMTVYPSPGACSERIAIFLAPIEGRIAPGGGLAEDGEDIEVRTFSLDEALAMVERGEIMDAKTILALQYAAHHWEGLKDSE